MKKYIWGSIILVIVILTIIATPEDKGPSSTEQKVTFGVIETLTGNAAFYGTQTQKGVDLAVEYLKETYPDYDFDLYHQDSEFTPKGGVDAYNALKQQHDLDVVITQSSPIAIAIKSLVKNDGLFQMALTAAATSYSSPGDFSFRGGSLTSEEASPMTKYISDKGYRSIAILFFQNEIGVSMAESLRESLSQTSPQTEIVLEEGFATTEQDFRTLVAKLKEAKPELVYVAGLGSNIGNIMNQSKDLGFETQFLSFRIAEDPTLLDVAGENADGIIYTYGFDVEDENPLVQDFTNRFEEKYGVVPDGYNAEAFMGTRLTGEAFRVCGIDYQCASDFLTRQEGHDSIFGNVKFDSNGDIKQNFFFKTVKNGEFIKLNN